MGYLLAWGISIVPYVFIVGAMLAYLLFAIVGHHLNHTIKASFAAYGIAGVVCWGIVFAIWVAGLGVQKRHDFVITHDPVSHGDEWFRYEFNDHPGRYIHVPRTRGTRHSVYAKDATAPSAATITIQYTYDWSQLRAYTLVDATGFDLVRPPQVSSFVWPFVPQGPPVPPTK